MVSRSPTRFIFLLATVLKLVFLFDELPAEASSALAAWNLDKNGVLKFRTSKGASLKAFFQYADAQRGDRIWIDFPGELVRPRTISGSGPVDEIRLGKPKKGFTRFVVEFKQSVAVDPYKLKLVGTSPDLWELRFVGIPITDLSAIGEGNLVKPVPISTDFTSTRYSKQKLELSDLPNVIQGRFRVVIDPGHGGPDVGAVGLGGIRENEVVLDISRQAFSILRSKGVTVKMTRNRDVDLDLYPRVAIANRFDADAFVSIHANAKRKNTRRDVNGIETFYYSGSKGFKLASLIQKEVVWVSAGSPDRGVRRSRFFVIRRTHMPAVLVETGFLTGSLDSSRLLQPSHRRQLALAIAKGVLLFLRGES